MSTQEQFYEDLKNIRNGYQQLYNHNKYLFFIDRYKDHIDHLYEVISKYYDVDYDKFSKLVYLTSM